MIEFVFWLLATYLAIYVEQVAYSTGVALTACWFGIEFEEFQVGYWSRLIQFKVGSTLYRFDFLPLGSHVKFESSETDAPDCAIERSFDAPDTTPVANPHARKVLLLQQPVIVRSAIFLAGPLSGVTCGLVFLLAAMSLPNSRVVVDRTALHRVKPSAVPGLTITDQSATPEAEIELFKNTFLAFWYPPKFFQRDWGGYIGMFVTCSIVGQQSLGAWLSCVGVFQVGVALLTLLPIPILPGGRVLFWILEAIVRRRLGRWHELLTVLSLLLLLLVYGLIFYCDARWLWSLWA